jgi:6-pyruvoyltetrahydropterin/6-carboxytetrahydropterin synthase
MYRVCVTGSFSAVHSLVGDFAEETIPHSHDYLLEWRYTVPSLDEQGFAVNIAHMEAARDEVFALVAGRNLNDEPFFRGRQTSIENLARYFSTTLEEHLRSKGFSRRDIIENEVRLWENDHAWASYIVDMK